MISTGIRSASVFAASGFRRDPLPDDVVHDHRGGDRGRVDGVDPDGVRRQPVGEGPHQSDDTVLGRREARGGPAAVTAAAGQALDGAGQRDPLAVSLLDHPGRGDVHRVPDAGQVDPDDFGPGPVRVRFRAA
jgi:hypothetical protein